MITKEELDNEEATKLTIAVMKLHTDLIEVNKKVEEVVEKIETQTIAIEYMGF